MLEVAVKAEGHLTSVLPEASFGKPPSVDAYQAAMASQLVRMISAAVAETKSLGADPIGFGQALRIASSATWQRLCPA